MKLPQLDRLGKPGIAGLGILLFCLSFYIGSIAPARDELASLQGQMAQLAPTARSARAAPGSAAPPASRSLPPFTNATDTLKELGGLAARYGLTVDRATYGLSTQEGRLRLEINLPLKGNYASLRGYLLEALAQPAAPTLDELMLQRPQASDPVIEANARLSYFFAPPS
ncbi:MAG: hypothetical protein ACM3X0_02310 [Bacteroidota bacterium]